MRQAPPTPLVRPRPWPDRLLVERLERRRHFAAVSGVVFNDYDADGVVDAGEPGLPGWAVYQDQNGNGARDTSAPVTVASTDVPRRVPDPGQATSSLLVLGLAGTIVDVDVTVSLTHSWVGDVTIVLVSPGGVQVTLARQPGGKDNSGDDFANTVFDDEAGVGIAAGTPPYAGRFRPVGALSQLDNVPPTGVWQLRVTDAVDPDAGTLTGWSLTLSVSAEPAVVTDGGGRYAFADLPAGSYQLREVVQPPFAQTSPAGGSQAVAVEAGDLLTSRNFGNRQPPAEVRGTDWDDLDGDAVRDAGEPGVSGVTVYADLIPNGAFDAASEPSAVTGADGTYAIQGVPPGNWVVREALPPDRVQTFPAVATTATAAGSPAAPPAGVTPPVAPAPPAADSAGDVKAPPAAAAADSVPVPAGTPVRPVWSPDTPRQTVDAFYAAETEARVKTGVAAFTFSDGDRWSTTATNGGGLTQGQGTTLTWNIVPDGTPVDGHNGEPAAPSNLRAFLTGIYGSEAAWAAKFRQIFDSWSSRTGVSYQRVAYDDGGPGGTELSAGAGQLGVRADVRIGGHFIDGNSNVLAYNFLPDVGDMVVDTGDSFFADTRGDSLGLRNVLSHEHGHGLGLNHVMPADQTKLMEPFVSFAFDGPQPDDVLAANRGYGDRFEKGAGNDTPATATPLGTVDAGEIATDAVSVDDAADVDLYRFSVPAARWATVAVTPTGSTYLSGPQGGPAPTLFDSLAQSDLAVAVVAADGTVLASADAADAGAGETLTNVRLPAAGDYFVLVTGDAHGAQMYGFRLTVASGAAGAHLLQVGTGQVVRNVDFGSRLASSVPAAVQAVAVNDGAAQRSRVTSLTVAFDRPVVLDVGAFVLTSRNAAGGGVSVSPANPSGDGRTWRLSFAGPGVVGGGLPDGIYDLTVVATNVHAGSAGGPASGANYGLAFHRKFGDLDGNGTVNNADYVRFRAAFGSSVGAAPYAAGFDFDGNGAINNLDYLQFRSRFGTTYVYI